mmetsp:Transcript_5313/g.15232  ORF Transcript_5313/g.15232 Transcript_5313/m.15232 type:complete len:230 (+) Transcript_5313:306-995(+)
MTIPILHPFSSGKHSLISVQRAELFVSRLQFLLFAPLGGNSLLSGGPATPGCSLLVHRKRPEARQFLARGNVLGNQISGSLGQLGFAVCESTREQHHLVVELQSAGGFLFHFRNHPLELPLYAGQPVAVGGGRGPAVPPGVARQPDEVLPGGFRQHRHLIRPHMIVTHRLTHDGGLFLQQQPRRVQLSGLKALQGGHLRRGCLRLLALAVLAPTRHYGVGSVVVSKQRP